MKSKQLELIICFKKETNIISLFQELYREHFKFKVQAFSVGKSKAIAWNEKDCNYAVENLKSDESFNIYNFNDKQDEITRFNIVNTGEMMSFKFIHLVYQNLNLKPKNIEKFIKHKGFIAAYLNSHYFFEKHNVKTSSSAERLNIPKEFTEKLPYKIDHHGQKIFDTSHNEGNKNYLKQTLLTVGSKMWLGPLYFDLVNKEKALKFEGALEINELTSDVLYINLFNDPLEAEKEDNLVIQRKWRNEMAYLRIINEYTIYPF